MKLFNTPLRKMAFARLQSLQKNMAAWLQSHCKKIPVPVQQLLLIIFCMLVTVYCVLLILQPFIN